MNTERKNKTIANLLMRIGLKNRPVAFVDDVKKKPKSLKLVGKRIVKPVAKVVKPIPKPRVVAVKYPDKKLVALSAAQRLSVKELMTINVKKGFALATKLDTELRAKNRPILAYNNMSQLKREQADEREGAIKLAIDTLLANLPKASELELDPNWKSAQLIPRIAEAAFYSSLTNDILWKGYGVGGLQLTVGAVTYTISLSERKLFDSVITRLYNWSGVAMSIDEDVNFIYELSKAAYKYESTQQKKKSSEYYLELLIAKVAETTVSVKREALILDYLAALSLAAATIAVKIGFKTDKAKSAIYIDCSDNKFGMTEISKKDFESYAKRIIGASNVAGKLKGDQMSKHLTKGILNHLTL